MLHSKYMNKNEPTSMDKCLGLYILTCKVSLDEPLEAYMFFIIETITTLLFLSLPVSLLTLSLLLKIIICKSTCRNWCNYNGVN